MTREANRQEAIAEMRKLAQAYDQSVSEMDKLEVPTFPPPPGEFVPPAEKWRDSLDLYRSGVDGAAAGDGAVGAFASHASVAESAPVLGCGSCGAHACPGDASCCHVAHEIFEAVCSSATSGRTATATARAWREHRRYRRSGGGDGAFGLAPGAKILPVRNRNEVTRQSRQKIHHGLPGHRAPGGRETVVDLVSVVRLPLRAQKRSISWPAGIS